MPGLRGDARRDDDDVGAGRVGVVVGAGDAGVVADDRGGLGEVEPLALRQALDDVDEDDVGQAGLGDPLGGGCADVAGADDGDLVRVVAMRSLLIGCRGWRPAFGPSGRWASALGSRRRRSSPVVRRGSPERASASRARRSGQARDLDRGVPAIGPAVRTASLTPSAYFAKFSWNIAAIRRAASS